MELLHRIEYVLSSSTSPSIHARRGSGLAPGVGAVIVPLLLLSTIGITLWSPAFAERPVVPTQPPIESDQPKPVSEQDSNSTNPTAYARERAPTPRLHRLGLLAKKSGDTWQYRTTDSDEIVCTFHDGQIIGNHRRVSDEIVEVISGSPDVHSVLLQGAGVTAEGLKHLAQSDSIVELGFYSCKLTEQHFRVLGSLPNLRRLSIADSGLKTSWFQHLRDLTGLCVDCDALSHQRIEEACPELLSSCSGVQWNGAWLKRSEDAEAPFANLRSGSRSGLGDVTSEPLRKTLLAVEALGADVSLRREDFAVIQVSTACLTASMASRLKMIDVPMSIEIHDDGLLPSGAIDRLLAIENLQSLDIETPQFDDPYMARLAGCQNLQYLYVTGASISDESLGHLAKLPRLKTVSFREMKIGNDGVKHLLRIRPLRGLTVRNCNVTPDILSHIARKDSLLSLDLRGCQLAASDIVQLEPLENLQYLNATVGPKDSQAGDKILHAFGRLKHLVSLTLDGMHCSVEGIGGLDAAERLDRIQLYRSSIGPLFYPEMGVTRLQGDQLRLTQLYTTNRSYFGGPANWHATRFKLDRAFGAELIQLSPEQKTGEAKHSKSITRLAIDEWSRGDTTHVEVMRRNGIEALDNPAETPDWMEGSPTSLHYAMVKVTARFGVFSTSCNAVIVNHQGLVAVPDLLYRNLSPESTFEVENALHEVYPAKLVGHAGQLALLQSELDTGSALPVTANMPVPGDRVVTVAGTRWNDTIVTAGVMSAGNPVNNASMKSSTSSNGSNRSLIVTNRPVPNHHLGAPVTNIHGQLVGLAMPMPSTNSGHALPVADLVPLIRQLSTGWQAIVATDDSLRNESDVPNQPVVSAAIKAASRSVLPIHGRKSVVQQGYAEEMVSLGSGIVIDARGHLLTMLHLVDEAHEITVNDNGQLRTAQVLARDEQTGLAIVEFSPGKSLTSLPFGQPDAIKVGDPVQSVQIQTFESDAVPSRAIIPRKQIVHYGKITATGRSAEINASHAWDHLIVCSIPLQPGQAGSPVLDAQGTWIGALMAIRVQGDNVSHVMPIDDVYAACRRMRKRLTGDVAASQPNMRKRN